MLMLCITTTASAAVLYDGSANTVPSSQGWVHDNVGVETVAMGAVTLDTQSDLALQSGYGTLGSPMDSSVGYTLSFVVQVLNEAHPLTDHRAGFSVIAVSADTSHAIELAFWQDKIWAQNIGFTHGEEAAFDTTAALVRYDLTVQGSGYTLSADGVLILSDNTRGYLAAGAPPLPYGIGQSIFLGDDTTSASGSFSLARVELNTIPEPCTATILVMTAFGVSATRARRKPTLL
jgi:hypothetical protein